MKVRTLGVIPARFGAQRFPGKPLAMIAGKPLIQRVYERASRAEQLDKVIVATEDTRILESVEAFGGDAMLTSPDCATGTDRVAEIARTYDCELVVNIQGDEPLMRPEMIDQLVDGMRSDPQCVMGTLARKLESPANLDNPNVVKVAIAQNGTALYFSRSRVPFVRDAKTGDAQEWLRLARFYKHLGIYAYRREFLLKFVQLPQAELEQTEKLEQLRALENGFPVKVWITPHDSIGVDRPEDIELVEEILKSQL
ncbi:MAG TPA: 3-deoxy-manno-octulosonate cytidylyltransferase [Verrucomicrobiae bacterium]|nr:3-deoxy-manno-octulosonate cytidylyltransferase [Verrucomicrobiae bacterium]